MLRGEIMERVEAAKACTTSTLKLHDVRFQSVCLLSQQLLCLNLWCLHSNRMQVLLEIKSEFLSNSESMKKKEKKKKPSESM